MSPAVDGTPEPVPDKLGQPDITFPVPKSANLAEVARKIAELARARVADTMPDLDPVADEGIIVHLVNGGSVVITEATGWEVDDSGELTVHDPERITVAAFARQRWEWVGLTTALSYDKPEW